MTTLPEYLLTLLPGRVLDKAPATPLTQPYAVWEQGAGSERDAFFSEGGRRRGVRGLTLAVYLYVPADSGLKTADTLTRQILDAENTVNAHPGLTVIDLSELSTIGPIWSKDAQRWISTVRFTLRSFKT